MSDQIDNITAEIGGNYTPAPADNHVGICVGVIVLGTIPGTYNGHPKKDKKVIISFELPHTNHVFREEKGAEPFVMHKEYTLSLNSKANLRKMLDGWASKNKPDGTPGGKLTDEELKTFNIASLVGAPCLVNVVHEVKEGVTRANIMSIAKVPQGTVVPANRTPKKIFTIKTPFPTEVFNSLPEWMRKKIESSDEYKALGGTGLPTGQPAAQENNPFATVTPTGNNITPENAAKLF